MATQCMIGKVPHWTRGHMKGYIAYCFDSRTGKSKGKKLFEGTKKDIAKQLRGKGYKVRV